MCDALVVHILKRDFPALAERVLKIAEGYSRDTILEDLELIPVIVSNFIKVFIADVESFSFMNRFNKHLMASSNGLLIKLGGSDVRNIVVAVLLKMYQPELFFGGASRSGLNISIAKALNCERDTVSKSISKAVFNYKTYIDFRNEVDFVYNILIKRDLQNGYRTN